MTKLERKCTVLSLEHIESNSCNSDSVQVVIDAVGNVVNDPSKKNCCSKLSKILREIFPTWKVVTFYSKLVIFTFCVTCIDIGSDFNVISSYKKRINAYASGLKEIEKSIEEMGIESPYNTDSQAYQELLSKYYNITESEREVDYCNVELLGKNETLLSESENLFMLAVAILFLSIFATVGSIRWLQMKLPFTNPRKVSLLGFRDASIRESVTVSEVRNCEWWYSSSKDTRYTWAVKSVLHVIEDIPQMCILIFMVQTIYDIRGFECQQRFFDWGKNGGDIKGFLLPVNLDAPINELVKEDEAVFFSILIASFSMLWTSTTPFRDGVIACIQGSEMEVDTVISCFCVSVMQFSTMFMIVLWIFYVELVIFLERRDTNGGRALFGFAVICSVIFSYQMYIGIISEFMTDEGRFCLFCKQRRRLPNIETAL